METPTGGDLPVASAFADDVDRQSIGRRFAVRLLPLLALGYFFLFLDRTNMPFVGLQISSALGLSATVFGLAVGMFSLGYCVFETPSTLMLKRVGARRWLCRIMVTWGILSAATAFMPDSTSLLVLRFVLGAAEAGFFPGIIYYLATWMPERERGRLIGAFLVAIPLSTVIGAPISGNLLGLSGVWGLAGWQWVFLAEGLPTVLLGFAFLFWLPDRPADVNWLSLREKDWLTSTIAAENQQSARFGTTRTFDALRSPYVWLLGLAYLGNGLGLFGIGAFLPSMFGKLGLSGPEVGYAVGLVYLVMAIVMVLWTRHSDRTGERIWHLVIPSFLGVAFLITAGLVGPGWPLVLALSAAIVLMNPATPQFWNLPPRLLSGDATAAGIGIINSVGALGAFLGPAMLGAIKDHAGGFAVGLFWLSAGPLVAAMIILALSRHPAFKRT